VRAENPQKIARYVTVSLKPATHVRLLSLLQVRESMDELVSRLIDEWIVMEETPELDEEKPR
jgi:hypothetical protein